MSSGLPSSGLNSTSASLQTACKAGTSIPSHFAFSAAIAFSISGFTGAAGGSATFGSSAGLGAAGCFAATAFFEQIRLVVVFDADAGVFNINSHRSVQLICLCAQLPAGWHGLAGIEQDVKKNLL